MPNPPPIQPDSTALLIVDVQERLLPTIHQNEAIIPAIQRMIEAAKILAIPILATEQYPAGIGPTAASIRACWGDVRAIEKLRFSACVEPLIEQLRRRERSHVIVTGIETHVCVQQTTLDLLRLGYSPYVCADAASSRRAIDRDVAFERMRQAGAIITTTESVMFELLGQAGTDVFKQILRLIK